VGGDIIQEQYDSGLRNWRQKGNEKMSETETFEQLKKLIVELLEVDTSKVVPEASFVDDFNADSLDFIELITAVEDAFKIEIPDEDAENLQTVQDAIDYIESKI
jgi:acyl carrier protein